MQLILFSACLCGLQFKQITVFVYNITSVNYPYIKVSNRLTFNMKQSSFTLTYLMTSGEQKGCHYNQTYRPTRL